MMKHCVLLILLLLAACPIAQAQTATDSHLHAVIISGGRNKMHNHERYWNDCAFIYKTLRQDYHLPERNITLLMADGDDPATDMLKANATGFISSPTDLDGDGQKNLSLAATLQNVTDVLAQLAMQLTPDDHLFLYIIDHGELDTASGKAFVWLWDNQQLSSYQLAMMLSAFHVASMNILLGQCYAGAFATDLSATDRIITTACTADEQAWACSDKPYDEFVYHWTCAIAGHDEQGVTVNADTNDDGHITMDEAYSYALLHDNRPETPGLSSLPIPLAAAWSFDSMISPNNGIKELSVGTNNQKTYYSLHGFRVTSGKGVLIANRRKTIYR